ncbi:MAG: hypothetical protein M0Q38_04375 [Bacteroidales bacterium]|nr:hypothetical protein [Bacteroidales bacterium]
MKINVLIISIIYVYIAGCKHDVTVDGVYRYYAGKRGGIDVWVVDGYKVRHKIYKEFLYGGNEQRYIFNPKGEIWIDHAISCEEFELTLAHELNERHLMAKFGWTYDRAHDSSLALEVVKRRQFQEVCRKHEETLPKVSPTDRDNRKEIRDISDSVILEHIYRIPVGERNGLSIWIVDGYLVRKNIFPDFGFSGNDLVYHFIPPREIWIDGQISCEEMDYSIAEEQQERAKLAQGKTFGEAYETAVSENQYVRDRMALRISKHPPVIVPDSLNRETGIIDPTEK